MQNKRPSALFPLAACLLFCHSNYFTFGQHQQDTTFFSKAYNHGLKLITTSSADTTSNKKSTQEYKSFEGKIIRKIHIRQIGFERSLYDSAKRVNRNLVRMANSLHTNTRERTLRNHLFIHEGEALNPYRVADNERYLRNLNFIMDTRLVVSPLAETEDSVDLIVITRDVFSLGAKIGGSLSAPSFGLYDKNADGRAQLLEFSGLINQDRSPVFGYTIKYGKGSIAGTLIDVEIGYSQINKGISYGEENEHAMYVRLKRPLVSSFSRMAGGAEISKNRSVNNYNEPDSVFTSYSYNIIDLWVGYNMGIRQQLNRQLRYFLAVRHFQGGYQIAEDQHDFDFTTIPAHSNMQGYLTEFTIYRQEFYKTRYIYGFGRTEDIPYGLSVSALAAQIDLYGIIRPYADIKFSYSKPFRNGSFTFIDLKVGTYFRNGTVEDAVLNSKFTFLSKAYDIGRSKFRGVISITNTHLAKREMGELIPVNRVDLERVSLALPSGENKTSLNGEGVLFLPGELLGVRFAPLVGASYVIMRCASCTQKKFSASVISAGFRARNENLIFGTVEVRASYATSSILLEGKFSLQFRQNLRIRNTYRFVKPPMIIQY